MSQLTNWEILHAYRHLVDEDKAVSLKCPNCENPVVTRLGKDDEPALWCYSCGTSIRPGLELLANLRAVVMEHRV